jgi:hypothetical protein
LGALWPKTRLEAISKKQICRNNFIQSPPRMSLDYAPGMHFVVWLFARICCYWCNAHL